eukprot:CAMPEP_0175594518 /NCGR_PEP_ID=MMETSP0096-20121207/54501_1 /TAXON_ID=311494 /ORGANISM="Alexandrium monilatum, Strain CCMP3105" /LENGTH=123 /DNA_ID=CAMNT_0016898839 /DNA_START=93 /DNA_END=463 /DNA_ORIENTATION=+
MAKSSVSGATLFCEAMERPVAAANMCGSSSEATMPYISLSGFDEGPEHAGAALLCKVHPGLEELPRPLLARQPRQSVTGKSGRWQRQPRGGGGLEGGGRDPCLSRGGKVQEQRVHLGAGGPCA